jgi:hypothetical protein
MTLSSQANENMGSSHPRKSRQSHPVPSCSGIKCNIGQRILVLITCFVIDRYVAYIYHQKNIWPQYEHTWRVGDSNLMDNLAV